MSHDKEKRPWYVPSDEERRGHDAERRDDEERERRRRDGTLFRRIRGERS